MGDMDMSVQQSPWVNVKTSGRHISLSAHRKPARVKAFVMKSQVIESIAKEHDTTSNSHSASSRTGNGILSIPLHRGLGKDPHLHVTNGRALMPGTRMKKQCCNLDPNTFIAPSKQGYMMSHWSIHNPGYYHHWLCRHGGRGQITKGLA